ncbi:MAG: siderophore-interacting protein [Myxococcota bacterium]
MLKPLVAKTVSRVLGRTGRVRQVETLSPNLFRVCLHGEELHQLRGEVGDKIKVDVGSGMRSYTPSRLAPGEVDFVVQAHGESAGSRWVRGLREGDEVRFFGPVRSLDLAFPKDVPWVAFYGDETTVGLVEALERSIGPSRLRGGVELATADRVAVRELAVDAVARDDRAYGDALVEHARSASWEGGGFVALSGEAGTVQRLRTYLLKEVGLAKTQLRVKPYWSVRGKAHRKQLERTFG